MSEPVSPAPSTGIFAMLDQWRGFALVLVLINHGLYHTGMVAGIGRTGVNLFFFISGLLVYRSLSRSREQSLGALWKSFVWRRFIRLYPALLAFIVLVLVISRIQLGEWAFPGAIRSLLFVTSYFNDNGPFGHLWSISVEAQFYALSPLLFWSVKSFDLRPRLQLTLIAFLMAVVMGFGVYGAAVYSHAGNTVNKYAFYVAVWPMFLGYFCEMFKETFARYAGLLVRHAATISVVALAVWVVIVCLQRKDLGILAGCAMMPACYLTYLKGWSLGGAAGHALEWIGQRTYSIYLWQQTLTLSATYPVVWKPLGAVISIGVGALSFRLFEKPFMSRKKK